MDQIAAALKGRETPPAGKFLAARQQPNGSSIGSTRDTIRLALCRQRRSRAPAAPGDIHGDFQRNPNYTRKPQEA